jgi:hypothetical protein
VISKLGSTVMVEVTRPAGHTSERVAIISPGPPGVSGDWGLSLERRDYLLVRRDRDGRLHATEGDRGEKE